MTPPAKSQRERDEEKRKQKLADIDEQVKSGRLTVREMTPEERERLMTPREPRGKGKR